MSKLENLNLNLSPDNSEELKTTEVTSPNKFANALDKFFEIEQNDSNIN